MLTNLHVKNLALIEEAEVSFENGLNILTGETGAGKSIIIGSVQYALGGKVGQDVIREGADYALVELVFQISGEELLQKIAAMDLPVEEDGTLILSRKIMPGRSLLKVCGESVTVKQAKELASLLIDIHGQHEHQSLLQPSKQRAVLDRFAGEELQLLKEELSGNVKEYRQAQEELEKLSMDESERQREISLARFEAEEIEDAALQPGEEEMLEQRYRKLQNARKIAEGVSLTLELLGRGESNAADCLGRGVHEMTAAADLDEDLLPLRERLVDAESMVSDIVHDMSRYLDDFSFGEEEFEQTRQRLDLINHLLMKYGGSIEKALAYGEERKAQLKKLEDLDSYLEELKARQEKKEKEIRRLCGSIHKIRTGLAAELSEKVTAVLEELNFLKVQFEISVLETEQFTQEGADEVSFMISLNPGEKPRPVAEIASGGELSRIMLALKCVFADKDETGTLIFDEIDTGISGRTAWKVSERMADISRKHQVICITHLPQIAAMADAHFKIEKKEIDGKTVTDIYPLDQEAMLGEVARLLGSDSITDAVLGNAKELKELAQKTKETC